MRGTRSRARARAEREEQLEGEDLAREVGLPESLSEEEGAAGDRDSEPEVSSHLLGSDRHLDDLDDSAVVGAGTVGGSRGGGLPGSAFSYRNPAFGVRSTPEPKLAKTPAQFLGAPAKGVTFENVRVSHTPPGKEVKSRGAAVGAAVVGGTPVVKGRKGQSKGKKPPSPDPSDSSDSSSSATSEASSEGNSGGKAASVKPLPQALSNPFPRGPRASLTPKLFTPVNSREFEQITENSFYQQFEAEVLISVLSYLHDWQAWTSAVADRVKASNPLCFEFADRSFAHITGVVDIVEDRYAKLVLRATCKTDAGKGAVEAWSVTRRGLCNGLYLPDRCKKVLKKIHDKTVSSLVSKAGKTGTRSKDSTTKAQSKGKQKATRQPPAGYKAQSLSDLEDAPTKQAQSGQGGQYPAKGRGRGGGGKEKKSTG